MKHRDQPTKSHWHWFEGHTTTGVEQAFITTVDASFSCIFLKWQDSIFIIWHYSAFTLLHLILLNYPVAVHHKQHTRKILLFTATFYQNLLQTLSTLTIEEVLTFAFNVRRTLFHVVFFIIILSALNVAPLSLSCCWPMSSGVKGKLDSTWDGQRFLFLNNTFPFLGRSVLRGIGWM